MSELNNLQRRLTELCEQLGVERTFLVPLICLTKATASPALEEIGQDLSRERVGEFNEEISRLFAEKTSRQVQVQNLVAEIKQLWEELCTDTSKGDEFDKAVRCVASAMLQLTLLFADS